MKYRITLSLNEDTRYMRIEAKHEYIEEETKDHLDEIYLTLLKSCEKADRKAFYKALALFDAENFDELEKCTEEVMRHEN